MINTYLLLLAVALTYSLSLPFSLSVRSKSFPSSTTSPSSSWCRTSKWWCLRWCCRRSLGWSWTWIWPSATPTGSLRRTRFRGSKFCCRSSSIQESVMQTAQTQLQTKHLRSWVRRWFRSSRWRSGLRLRNVRRLRRIRLGCGPAAGKQQKNRSLTVCESVGNRLVTEAFFTLFEFFVELENSWHWGRWFHFDKLYRYCSIFIH